MPTLTVTGAYTGAGAPPADGTVLAVDVLIGAAPVSQQTGATFAAEEATHTPQASITPTFTGSMIAGMAEYAPNTAIGSIASGTTVISSFTDTIIGAAAFRNNTGTTASTPVTVGGNTPSTTNGELVLAEIRSASTSPPTVDASSPAPVTSATAQSLTTASFSPPPGSLLVVYFGGYDGGVGTVGTTISDSMGLAWTNIVSRGTAGQGVTAIWIAQVPAVNGQTPIQPGPTWLRRFRPRQIQPQIVSATTPVTLAGVVTNITVDAPIGGVAPAVYSPVMAQPGLTWERRFLRRQIPVPNSNTVVFGTTATITVSSQFADETVSVLPQGTASAITVAVTGETLLTSVSGVVANISVDSPAGTLAESDAGAVAAITVAVPTQTILETVTGTTSQVTVTANAGNVLYLNTSGQQAQPGSTWRRFFQHKQEQQNPVTIVAGTVVAGVVAQISVAGLPGSISTGAGGTVSTVTVSSTGTVSVSASATSAVSVAGQTGTIVSASSGVVANISVAGIAGTLPRTLTGTTAQVNVAANPGNILTGSGLAGVTATITVAAQAGTFPRILAGTTAQVTVSSTGSVRTTLNGVVSAKTITSVSGTITVNQAGKSSGITVIAHPGSAGQIIITNKNWSPLIWRGRIIVPRSGKSLPNTWTGKVIPTD